MVPCSNARGDCAVGVRQEALLKSCCEECDAYVIGKRLLNCDITTKSYPKTREGLAEPFLGGALSPSGKRAGRTCAGSVSRRTLNAAEELFVQPSGPTDESSELSSTAG